MTRIGELFGVRTDAQPVPHWQTIVDDKQCPYLARSCVKTRKSAPDIAIGTCSVYYGTQRREILIFPHRLLARQRQVFIDCLHLLTLHEPGNQLHVVSEFMVPGGSVDYVLASVRDSRVVDFVGIELQTLDTTGTVWPERQRFLAIKGIPVDEADTLSRKPFGINWKMTAKTILVQLHHKSESFESLNKHIVLATQNVLLDYLRRNFQFGHITQSRIGDPVQVHSYSTQGNDGENLPLRLAERLSTDSQGVATSLGLQTNTNIELRSIVEQLEAKINDNTLLPVV